MRKRGQVYWVHFDPSVGSEIQKTRPAIIVSIDEYNRRGVRYQVVPLSNQVKTIYPNEVKIKLNGRESKAIASQVTTVSRERFGKRFGVLSPHFLSVVESALANQLGLKLEEE